MPELERARVLRGRHAEEQEMAHAGIEVARDHVQHGVPTVTRVVAKAGDGIAAAEILDDKQGLDELGDRKCRFSDQIPEMLRLAKPQAGPGWPRRRQETTA